MDGDPAPAPAAIPWRFKLARVLAPGMGTPVHHPLSAMVAITNVHRCPLPRLRSRVRGMAIAPGLRASVRLVVTDTDTAVQIGSGDVSVLATPRLLALAEAAAVAAITPSLEPGLTSVGTAISMEHKRASAVGAEVVVEAELTEVEGRRLVFSFVARQKSRESPESTGDTDRADEEEAAVVGAGTVERVVVDRERFVAGAQR